jgi:methyltransferase (TIGR00027 family)
MTITNNQWDIATGPGLTALVVAALRAVETGGSKPLFHDPFAAKFVHAADTVKPLPVSPEEIEQGERRALFQFAADGVALRTRHLDDYFSTSRSTQAVILAAGLDTRAFRLDWPPGWTVFEVDQAPVLEFKQQVLDRAGALARCDRRPVAVDLRDDWGSALVAAGYERTRPTAWLAEGLLPYLPPAAEESLVNRVHEFSVAGSSIAVWAMAQDAQHAGQRLSSMYNTLGVDIPSVMNTEPRRNTTEYLSAHGWTVTENTMSELARRYGRPLSPSRRRLSSFTAHKQETDHDTNRPTARGDSSS